MNQSNFPFKIITENEHFLAINKPAGITVHEGINVISKTLVQYLKEYFIEKGFTIFNQRCGLVHRLDRDTSGICIVAKNLTSYEKFKQIFRDHLIKKTYVALAWKSNQYPVGSIIHFECQHQRRKNSAYYEIKAGLLSKTAVGIFKIIAEYQKIYWIEINLVTGRTHQIRLQLQNLGMPVINDKIYSKKRLINISEEYHYLHALSIEFPAFWTKENIQCKIVCEIPNRFKIRFRTKYNYDK